MRRLTIIYFLLLLSCQEFEPGAKSDSDILDGPIEGLSPDEHLRFMAGDVAFNDGIFTTQNGLGPLFVATSCGSCHAGDGKGHPFTTLTRFGQSDQSGNLYLAHGGPQLQNRAIPGFTPEVIPAGAPSTRLTPPANTGLGFLDAVTDTDILAMEDPNDVDGDGISGVANWISLKNYTISRPGSIQRYGGYFIGRFGKKGAAYDLLQQTAGAYNQDMGVTSSFEPVDTYSGLTMDPEVSNQTLQNVVFYLKTLKAPVPRSQEDADVLSGKQLFTTIKCSACHKPEMKTGLSDVASLSQKTFYPYTDLLLHDMGPGLNDGYTEGSALAGEWKTPPLWGLGLSKNSQGGNYFLLHDGRATSIQNAIIQHGGEADVSKNKFVSLSETQKKQLIKFLESL